MAQIKGSGNDTAPAAVTSPDTVPTATSSTPVDTRQSIGANTNEHISEAQDTSPIAADAANYMSSSGKPLESYPYYDKMSINDISAAKLKGQAQLSDLQNRTSTVGKVAQGVVGATQATVPSLAADTMVPGGKSFNQIVAGGGTGGNVRGIGYPGPASSLDWKDTGNKAAAAAKSGKTTTAGAGAGAGAGSVAYDMNGSSGVEDRHGGNTSLNGSSGIENRDLPKPGVDKPSDLGDKIKGAMDTFNTNGGWGKALNLMSGILDAYGVAKSAYGGNFRQTQAQKNLDTQREIQRQKAATQNQAAATISTYQPLTDQKLREIEQEYKSSGDKDVYVSKLNYMRNLGLIDEQRYMTYLNGQTGLQNQDRASSGGKNVETAASDVLKSPGGSGND